MQARFPMNGIMRAHFPMTGGIMRAHLPITGGIYCVHVVCVEHYLFVVSFLKFHVDSLSCY